MLGGWQGRLRLLWEGLLLLRVGLLGVGLLQRVPLRQQRRWLRQAGDRLPP